MTSASLRSSAAGLPNGRAGTWSHLRPKLFALCPASSWCSNMFFWIKLHQDISLLLPTPLRTNTIAFKVKSLKIERERSAGTQCLPRTGLMRATENVPLTPHHQANTYQVTGNSAGGAGRIKWVRKETLSEAQRQGKPKAENRREKKPSGKPASTLDTKYR